MLRTPLLLSLAENTYYSSQSGRVMTLPGALGLRLHLACPPNFAQKAAALVRPTSIVLPPSALPGTARGAFSPCLLAAPAPSPPWADILTLEVDASAPRVQDGVDGWSGALSAARAAVAAGLRVRLNLLHALAADPTELQLVAGLFADAGVTHLALVCEGGGDDVDALEAACEAVLWLDVVGETMLDRLGVVAADPELIAAASKSMKLSVFDARVGRGDPRAPLASALLTALAGCGRAHGRDVAAVEALEREVGEGTNRA